MSRYLFKFCFVHLNSTLQMSGYAEGSKWAGMGGITLNDRFIRLRVNVVSECFMRGNDSVT
jgi:hypothetical protein